MLKNLKKNIKTNTCNVRKTITKKNCKFFITQQNEI